MDVCERPSKKDIFEALLNAGWVSLHIDARRAGVVVPTSFASLPDLVLQYGRDMPIPVVDLDVTDAGVSATLSFAGVPHRTYVPWPAVYIVACSNGAGLLYHEDVPREVSLVGFGAQPLAEPSCGRGDDTGELPLSVDDAWLPPDRASASVAGDGLMMRGPVRRRRRPQLRLVK